MDDSPTMDYSSFYMTKKGEYMCAMCHTSSISKISMKLLLFLLGTKRFKNRVQSSIDCSIQQLRNQILCIENIFVHYALHTAIIFCHFFLSLITDFVLIFFYTFFFSFQELNKITKIRKPT